MKIDKFEWNGFKGEKFDFEGLSAHIVFPNVERNGRWALKTEYWDAFPATEIELLNRGWCIAYNQNYRRITSELDLNRKRNFIDFISKTYSLDEKCTIVGMSCGGMYGIDMAALCPELIQAMYLDAPVVNLLSWPLRLGRDPKEHQNKEFFESTGMTISQALGYRNHPLDKFPILAENKIPIILVSGDCDDSVPFHENGARLEEYYKQRGLDIIVHIKPGGGHHPHGYTDVKLIADEIESYYA